ncbi:MAG: DUF1800 domain-containing protein [Flavobacteriaceae bacterium]
MDVLNSCNTGSFNLFIPSVDRPWNKEKVNHLYRRLGFGVNKEDIDNALAETPRVHTENLVDDAIALPVTEAPEWADWNYSDYVNMGLDFTETNQQHRYDWSIQAFNDFRSDGLRGMMTLFWSNHFVTELQVYNCASYLYKYYNLLQTHALGNFKDFVREIGLSEAMLIYLNGFENTEAAPNENYARELYELFTLGVNNGYNQTDIVETAKALTGYNFRPVYCGAISFNVNTFNNNEKTIFGRTGNWGYDDVIDILFEEKGSLIAHFICTKLYKYFVSPTINQDIINEMVAIFEVDFNIGNVLKRLFRSEHFFDSEAIGTQIKSPYDLTHNYLKTTGFTISNQIEKGLHYLNGVVGQQLFNPPDVAGWQGDHDWINSSTLTGRWDLMGYLLYHTWNNHPEEFRTFAIDSSNNSNDVAFVTKSIIDRFIPKEFHESLDYNVATDIFKGDIPQNYFDDNLWSLSWDEAPYQVTLLLSHLTKIPEFQLK